MDEKYLRELNELLKVMDVTTGANVIRQDLSDILYEVITPIDTPLRNRFARTQGEGKAHMWSKLVDIGEGSGWFYPGQLPSSNDSTYIQETATYKALGQIVKILDHYEAAGKSFNGTSPLAREIRNKLLALASSEEYGLLYGDSTVGSTVTDAFWGGGALGTKYLQFDGLDKQITTNVVDALGVVLTPSLLDEAMQLAYEGGGSTRAFVMSTRDVTSLSQYMFEKIQVLQSDATGAIKVGTNVTAYHGPFGEATIIPHRKIVPSSAGTEYSDTTTIFCLDDESPCAIEGTGAPIEVVDLIKVGSEELARITTGRTWVVTEMTVLTVPAEPFQAKIINVGTTPAS